jgi:hypothetical protein
LGENLATWAQRSEDTNFVSVHIQQIVVNSEEANEGKEKETVYISVQLLRPKFWPPGLSAQTKVVINRDEANKGEELEDGLHFLSASWAEILATWAQRSEDTNFVHVQEVFVNGEQANEGEKDRTVYISFQLLRPRF